MRDIHYLKILKTFAFSLLILYVFESKAQKSAQEMHLQGNVSRLFTHKYIAKNIVIEENKLVSYEKGQLLQHIDFIFEKNGLLLAENRFNNQDLIELSFIYEYDEQNRLFETTFARNGKILIGRVEYKYGKDGKKSQEIEFDNRDSLKTTTAYKYDTLGNLISEKVYNKEGKLAKDIRYQYDEKENLIFKENLRVFMFAGKPYQEVQKFDKNNNLIYKSYTERDTLKWEYFASYNKNDSLIYEELKDGDGKLESYSKLTFKDNKRISLSQYNSKATIQNFDTQYQYDKKNRLFKENLYAPNRKDPVIIRTYFYDEKDNCIYCLEEDKINNMNTVLSRRFNYF